MVSITVFPANFIGGILRNFIDPSAMFVYAAALLAASSSMMVIIIKKNERCERMSKTDENLMAAFSGESQARNKYDYFAKVARKEGYHYIAKIFEETALNEMQHAKEEFKLLKGISGTAANLKEAVEGEHHETSEMYPGFAKQAEKDGNKEAAVLFSQVAEVEKEHEQRYKRLLEMVENGTVYKREKPIKWRCSKCGFIHEGKQPPGKCPCCKHEMEYFEPECMCFRGGCESCN